MADLNVRRENGNQTSIEWDPIRAMRSLLRWDPFGQISPLTNTESLAQMPAFDVKETKTGFVFKADVPGFKEGDLDVSLTGNRLTIQGKRESEKKDESETYYVYERSSGSFVRAFTLPDGIDGTSVHAALKDGVLTIDIAKLPEMQPKKIPVTGASKAKA